MKLSQNVWNLRMFTKNFSQNTWNFIVINPRTNAINLIHFKNSKCINKQRTLNPKHWILSLLRLLLNRKQIIIKITCFKSNVMVTHSYCFPFWRVGLCHQLLVPSIAFSIGCLLSALLASQVPQWSSLSLCCL